MLQREEVKTLEQLMKIAGRLEQFDGMEPRLAEVSREALARVAPPEEQTMDEMQLGP